jgi:proline-specific peptidase
VEKIFDVTGGPGGNAYLLVGEERTALIDSGMAFCAAGLIANVKTILAGRSLDYIFISHSHYDHVGAIPYLRAEWPTVLVLGAEYAKAILARHSAQKVIRVLGEQAAKLYGAGEPPLYDPTSLQVDRTIGDGDCLDLGGLTVKVIETKGHTKCSLAFLIDGQTLFASESTGCMSTTGRISPAFITSFTDAAQSIAKCQALNARFIISPHYGLVRAEDTPGYWPRCLQAAEETRGFVLRAAAQGYDEEQILDLYARGYRDEHNRSVQPEDAFRLNNASMIKALLKERGVRAMGKHSITEGTVPVAGGKVWYRIVGQERPGLPLLVLHGGPGAPHDYLEPLTALADKRPVIFYDQLGCGNSDRPDDPSLWNTARFVEELAVVQEALGLEKFHILGQSWGTMLAVEYMLAKKPAGVCSLVLSGPFLSAGRWIADQRAYLAGLPAGIQASVAKAEAAGDYESADYQQAMQEYYRRYVCRLDPWPEVMNRTFAKMGLPVYLSMWGPSEFTCTGSLKDRDLTGRLREIAVPVLFTCGRFDEATPAATETYHRALPGSEMVVFEDASHNHHLEKPAEFLAAVGDFLSRAEQGGDK